MTEQTRELAAVHDAVLADHGVTHRSIEAVDGEALHVLEHGDGPPLVMLHGSGPTSLQFLPLIERISRARVTAIDRPGFGLSDPHAWAGPRRKAVVDWLDDALEALVDGPVTLLGSSAGGTWALWYALARPDRVERLVLLGAPPALSVTSPPAPLRMVASIDPANPPAQPPPSDETVIGSMAAMGEGETIKRYPDLIHAMIAAARDATSGRSSLDELRSLIAPDGWQPEAHTDLDELSSLVAPTLIIWGRNDPLGGENAAKALAGAIAGARLEMLDAGHAPWLGHPDAVAELVAGFTSGD